MTDGMIQAIATVTVAFLGILVPILTIVYKRTGKIHETTATAHQLLEELCKELKDRDEPPHQRL